VELSNGVNAFVAYIFRVFVSFSCFSAYASSFVKASADKRGKKRECFMAKQKTIKEEIKFSGIGLHTGEN
jgi:hypothetical protein